MSVIYQSHPGDEFSGSADLPDHMGDPIEAATQNPDVLEAAILSCMTRLFKLRRAMQPVWAPGRAAPAERSDAEQKDPA